FFFSSRRRHTRSKRDWSSDVCSSDLARCFTTSLQGAVRLRPSVLQHVARELRSTLQRESMCTLQRQSPSTLPRVPEHPSASVAKDRKSTRLNSSHVSISYAVFCLKKK